MKTLGSLWYFILAAVCISHGVVSDETLSPTTCPPERKPVCASDDVTYANQCQFEVAKSKNPALEVIYLGECCPDACPLTVEKVCSSTGETYTSACEFLRARCNSSSREPRIVARGPCHVNCSHFKCDEEEADPVCGSDYKTYRNECALRRAQCESGSEENPWLTSNSSCDGAPPNNTRDSLVGLFDMPVFLPTELDDEGNEPNGATATTARPAISSCPGSGFQVCASDGVSYRDVCEFVSARHLNGTVTFVKLGTCVSMNDSAGFPDSTTSMPPPTLTMSQPDQCDFACPTPDRYDPVCTTDGAVYENRCVYVRALCRDAALSAASADNCDPLVLPPCPTLAVA